MINLIYRRFARRVVYLKKKLSILWHLQNVTVNISFQRDDHETNEENIGEITLHLKN